MKKASTAIALSLAAAFACAEPVFAQDEAPPAANIEKSAGAIPAVQRDKRFEDLSRYLEEQKANDAQRRADIAAAIRAKDSNISDEALALRVDEILTAEHEALLKEREARIANDDRGAPYTDMPEKFEKAVRGCTVDGYIYRIPYNLTVNETDVYDLFQRMTMMAPDATLGVSGTKEFFSLLKNVTGGIHTAMQSSIGPLIDEASSDIIADPASFDPLLKSALETIMEGVEKRYDIRTVVTTGEPKKQGGRCAVAQPAQPDDQTPQPVDPNQPPVAVDPVSPAAPAP